MNKLAETINTFVIDSWGGILAFWAAIVLSFSKLCYFVGRFAAKGLVEELISSIMPRFEDKIHQELKPIKKALNVYKEEKHKADNELAKIKGAIIFNDEEVLERIRSERR